MTALEQQLLNELESAEKREVLLQKALEEQQKAFTNALEQIVLKLNSSEIDEKELKAIIGGEPLPQQLNALERGLESLQRSFQSFVKQYEEEWTHLLKQCELG